MERRRVVLRLVKASKGAAAAAAARGRDAGLRKVDVVMFVRVSDVRIMFVRVGKRMEGFI